MRVIAPGASVAGIAATPELRIANRVLITSSSSYRP